MPCHAMLCYTMPADADAQRWLISFPLGAPFSVAIDGIFQCQSVTMISLGMSEGLGIRMYV